MTQPPPPEREPAEEPARDSGVSGGGADVPGGGVPGGGPQAPDEIRDPRLAGFVKDGPEDTCPPSAALAAVVEDLSGPERRCEGATDDELVGPLGRWDALEAWAAAGKLGVVRELIRRRARPGPGGYQPMHGDLPDQWHEGLAHEVSVALGLSIRGADKLTCFAWDLAARLPGIGAALAAGTISEWKAKLISDELAALDDEHAAEAEKLILDQIAGQPPGVIGRLAAQAACTVDPGGAAKRRQHAEREEARVRFWRANGGACALAAYGLPTDAALAANDAIEDRAQRYKRLKVCPDARLDQLRVLAFLDILNGITLETRLAQSRADTAAAQQERSAAAGRGGPPERGPDGAPADGGNPAGAVGSGAPDDWGAYDWDAYFGDHGEPDDEVPGDSVADPGGSAASGPDGPVNGASGAPGGGYRDRSGGMDLAGTPGPGVPDDDWFTSHYGDSGEPIVRSHGSGADAAGDGSGAAAALPLPSLAARANLTLPLATLLGMAERPGAGHALGPLDPALVRDLAATAANSPASEWSLTITDGEGVAVAHGCARAARTKKTSPPPASRDGPQAPRHGRSPRATNHDQGGKTCACNGGARSRRCHRVKQSPGWSVTQPEPGLHQWTTPSGRTYTQGPMRYPA